MSHYVKSMVRVYQQVVEQLAGKKISLTSLFLTNLFQRLYLRVSALPSPFRDEPLQNILACRSEAIAVMQQAYFDSITIEEFLVSLKSPEGLWFHLKNIARTMVDDAYQEYFDAAIPGSYNEALKLLGAKPTAYEWEGTWNEVTATLTLLLATQRKHQSSKQTLQRVRTRAALAIIDKKKPYHGTTLRHFVKEELSEKGQDQSSCCVIQ